MNNNIEIIDTACCGLLEIDGLSHYNNSKEAMLDVCHELELKYNSKPNCAFLLFTGVVKDEYGQKFAEYIRKHKLGTVKAGGESYNPNSTHIINAWLWKVDGQRLKQWYVKNNKDKDDNDY